MNEFGAVTVHEFEDPRTELDFSQLDYSLNNIIDHNRLMIESFPFSYHSPSPHPLLYPSPPISTPLFFTPPLQLSLPYPYHTPLFTTPLSFIPPISLPHPSFYPTPPIIPPLIPLGTVYGGAKHKQELIKLHPRTRTDNRQ